MGFEDAEDALLDAEEGFGRILANDGGSVPPITAEKFREYAVAIATRWLDAMTALRRRSEG